MAAVRSLLGAAMLRKSLLRLQKRHMSAAVSSMKEILSNQLKAIEDAGTWKSERVITSPQDGAINIEGTEKKVLNFCANNYLGLSAHPDVVHACESALESHGAGLSSVRFICGTQNIHKDLEEKIAKFHRRTDSILYISCFDANAGLFEVLLTPEDAVISDELNHASIIDGIRLCKAKKFRYKHKDMADLEAKLQEADAAGARMKLIATDGVFSMDGNVAPLDQICDLADKYNALTFIDECHATGFFGETGRGTEEHFGMVGRVTIVNSTLGKALGGAAGGYTTAPKELVQLLRQKSRPYLFSNSCPPAIVASASKVFDMLMDGSPLTKKVMTNTKRFREKMTQAGFNVIGDGHPICPVMMPDERTAVAFSDAMIDRGIYVIGFTFPVVPRGKARIRVQMSAAHTTEQVDECINAFIEVGKEMGVI
ncbi:2-amino-3-ketobutyrate coenzyme A ligase, mitochondrial-like [Rhopilema esculentum]|uniref:2-amino-3-ketobutyrate coenzyme A ligase, mitochondrial-like n=2 Tax=Rhopilema esculentum TaxID=499914 RepID=UPI0031D7BE90